MKKNSVIALGVCSVSAVVGLVVKLQGNENTRKELLYSEHAMIHLTGKWEGCRTKAYKDTGGLWTNGIGHLCGKYKPTDDMTLDDVAKRYLNDIWLAEQCVLTHFNGKELSQGQREALTDFVFNVGCNKAIKNRNGNMTKIRRYAITGQYTAMCNEFLNWSKGRNNKGELVTIKGLYNRRLDEKTWCLK